MGSRTLLQNGVQGVRRCLRQIACFEERLYRLMYQNPGSGLSGEVLKISKGKALLDADDRFVG